MELLALRSALGRTGGEFLMGPDGQRLPEVLFAEFGFISGLPQKSKQPKEEGFIHLVLSHARPSLSIMERSDRRRDWRFSFQEV